MTSFWDRPYRTLDENCLRIAAIGHDRPGPEQSARRRIDRAVGQQRRYPLQPRMRSGPPIRLPGLGRLRLNDSRSSAESGVCRSIPASPWLGGCPFAGGTGDRPRTGVGAANGGCGSSSAWQRKLQIVTGERWRLARRIAGSVAVSSPLRLAAGQCVGGASAVGWGDNSGGGDATVTITLPAGLPFSTRATAAAASVSG